MPEKNSTFTAEDLNKLKLLDNCINETLRVLTPVSIIAREPNKPFKLKNGIVIPKGVPIAIGIRQIHRSKEYWGEDSHKFVPSRFDNIDLKNLPPTHWMPFSAGPRNCNGILHI